jgi:hypothetical protein
MVRVVVYVTLLALLFCGAVLWAGNAMGSWEPPSVPGGTLTTKSPNHHGKHPEHPKHPKHSKR